MRMVSTQVGEEEVDSTEILGNGRLAEGGRQRCSGMLEQLRQRMLERSASASHNIYEAGMGRVSCATARVYC
jgi:hypothetical protein